MRFKNMIVNPAHADVVARVRRRSSMLGIATFLLALGVSAWVLRAGDNAVVFAVASVASAGAGQLMSWTVRQSMTVDRQMFLPVWLLDGLYVPVDADAIRLWAAASEVWSVRLAAVRFQELDEAEVLTEWRESEREDLERQLDDAHERAAVILDPMVTVDR